MHTSFAAMASILVLAGPAAGHAQDAQEAADVAVEEVAAEPPPPSPAEEEARALFSAGRVAFEQGHLDRALEHFQRAYELSPQPGLLFNIGNTYDRLRQDELAIEHLERYLEALPEAENADFVRARIEVLRGQVEERAAAERAHEEERARLIEAANEPPDATASDVGIALMIGAAVPLLGTIGGGVWWAATSRAVDDCDPRRGCMNPRELLSRQDAAMGLTIALLITGVLGEAGGLVLFLVSPRGGGDTDPAPAVACGPLGCTGRF